MHTHSNYYSKKKFIHTLLYTHKHVKTYFNLLSYKHALKNSTFLHTDADVSTQLYTLTITYTHTKINIHSSRAQTIIYSLSHTPLHTISYTYTHPHTLVLTHL